MRDTPSTSAMTDAIAATLRLPGPHPWDPGSRATAHDTLRSLIGSCRALFPDGSGAPTERATHQSSDTHHTRLLSGIAALSRSRGKPFTGATP
ncbi:hypothetical protein SALBM311S_01121 [Streptomyces alboniger]